MQFHCCKPHKDHAAQHPFSVIKISAKLQQNEYEFDNVPMWVGFNSKFYTDQLPKQTVHYMQNLRQPTTSLGVIQETHEIDIEMC